jgi:hypothetical protein
MLCNDRAVLGPWVNKPWLNAVAGIIVSSLIALSMILVVSTLIPTIDVTRLLLVLSALTVAVWIVGGARLVYSSRRAAPEPEMSRQERENWRMPALALLERPKGTLTRRITVWVLSGYVVLGIILLAVKSVEIALHQ